MARLLDAATCRGGWHLCGDGRAPNLQLQALDAWMAHSQITKLPADANAFKIPTVWNARSTAPYFHYNGAKNPDELLNHYQQYFNFVENVVGIPGFGTSNQDKADIRAYLELL